MTRLVGVKGVEGYTQMQLKFNFINILYQYCMRIMLKSKNKKRVY